jgi:hypothetical protein
VKEAIENGIDRLTRGLLKKPKSGYTLAVKYYDFAIEKKSSGIEACDSPRYMREAIRPVLSIPG